MRLGALAVILVVWSGSLSGRLAVADEPPPEVPTPAEPRPEEPKDDKAGLEEARVYFDAGKQAYESGDYQTAIRSFEHAYEKVPRPEIAFSLAQAYRKQFVVDTDAAKLRRAVELYRRYLDEVPSGGRREDAVSNLGELQPQLDRVDALKAAATPPPAPPPPATQLMVMSPVAGAHVAIDEGELATAPLTREVAPGHHRIHAEAAGFVSAELDGLAVEGRLVVIEATLRERPALLAVDAAAGADVTLDGRPIDAGTAISAPAGRHVVVVSRRGHVPWVREVTLPRGQLTRVHASLEATGQRTLAKMVFGLSALLFAGGATTTTLAFVAEDHAQDLLDKKDRSGWSTADLAEYNHQRSRRDTFILTSGIVYGAATAAAVSGLILYLADTPAAPRLGREIVPAAGPGEVGVSLAGRF